MNIQYYKYNFFGGILFNFNILKKLLKLLLFIFLLIISVFMIMNIINIYLSGEFLMEIEAMRFGKLKKVVDFYLSNRLNTNHSVLNTGKYMDNLYFRSFSVNKKSSQCIQTSWELSKGIIRESFYLKDVCTPKIFNDNALVISSSFDSLMPLYNNSAFKDIIEDFMKKGSADYSYKIGYPDINLYTIVLYLYESILCKVNFNGLLGHSLVAVPLENNSLILYTLTTQHAEFLDDSKKVIGNGIVCKQCDDFFYRTSIKISKNLIFESIPDKTQYIMRIGHLVENVSKEFFNLDGSFCKENIDRFFLDKGLPIKLTPLNETAIFLDDYYKETFSSQKVKSSGIKNISDAINNFSLDLGLSKGTNFTYNDLLGKKVSYSLKSFDSFSLKTIEFIKSKK